MVASRIRTGFAGLLVSVLCASAQAQEAAPQQASSGCSGFMCIFSSGSRQAAPVAPAPVPAAEPSSQDSKSADLYLDPKKATASDSKKATTAPAKHVITIAADPNEFARLKTLSSVSPQSRLKFVRSASNDADFKVTTTVGDLPDHGKVKLFTEQIHIVAGGAIHSLADLKNKVVSFGPADGPTAAVARKAFDALNIPVKDTPLDYDNAFDGLATGDVDAVVLVAPQGVTPRLAKLKVPGLHLVSWPEQGALPSGATVGTIQATSYPNLVKDGSDVRAVNVDAVLNMNEKGAKQAVARRFFASVAQHSAALSRKGFDLIKADLESRSGNRLASAERR